MNEFKRCLCCFEEINGQNPCPKCKWDKAKRVVGLHLEPGQTLNNRYMLGRVLGQGGFGITYLGWDKNLQTKVAVKEYLHTRYASRKAGKTGVIAHGNYQQDFADGVEQFLAEARILAKFNTHPNIVTVIDFFKANGTGYFVMQFVPGMTLKEMLQQYGRLGWWEAVKIFMQIADGLRAAHSKNILHRDISSDNIYLETTPQRERIIRALLMDFGNFKRIGEGKGQGNKLILKDGFAPPEQYTQHGEQGPWTDVYALGATLYTTLTGKEPVSSMERTGTDTLPPAKKLIPALPGELAELLDSALALKPEKRPKLEKVCKVLNELLHKKPHWWELLQYQFQQQLGLILTLCFSITLAGGVFWFLNKPYTDGELDTIMKSCQLSTTKQALPGWQAVIEVGSSGIKPLAMQFDDLVFKTMDKKFDAPKAINDDIKKFEEHQAINDQNDEIETSDVTPKEPKTLPRVVETVCGTIKELHNKYGDLPIYLVGSSGVANAPHRPDMENWLLKATGKDIEFINARQEMVYLSRGAWKNLSIEKRCKSSLVDIGSGNIKGGYISHCSSDQAEGDLKFETFNIDDFGTKGFTKKVMAESVDGSDSNSLGLQLQKWLGGKNAPSTVRHTSNAEAVKNIGGQLQTVFTEQLSLNPEITSNKNSVYLVGGAVWGMNTLMCLDCPQYDSRSNTESQKKFTAIKLSDINEFYRYVTTTDAKEICAPDDYPNPYLSQIIDDHSATILPPDRVRKQNEAIKEVCSKFPSNKSSNALISMAEILRTTAIVMEIDERRQLFFMQDQLYTWPREYLIEKIQTGGKRE